jgi:hypothetical protein
MSNIPPINPIAGLDREQVALLLLASIAFEELSLAHIMNAEGEKLQYALGTLENGEGPIEGLDLDLEGLLAVNRSVERTLRSVIKKEMLLQFKLEDILDSGLVDGNGPTPPPPGECECSAEALVNEQIDDTTAIIIVGQETYENVEGNVSGRLRICDDCEVTQINYNFNSPAIPTIRPALSLTFDQQFTTNIDCTQVEENEVLTVTGLGRTAGNAVGNQDVTYTLVFDGINNTVHLTLNNLEGEVIYEAESSVPVAVDICPPAE